MGPANPSQIILLPDDGFSFSIDAAMHTETCTDILHLFVFLFTVLQFIGEGGSLLVCVSVLAVVKALPERRDKDWTQRRDKETPDASGRFSV